MLDVIKKISALTLREANAYLESQCGIVDFFPCEEERREFISCWAINQDLVAEDRVSYGDWQTPEDLAESVCNRHKLFFGEPDIVIEPTCGKGAFILSVLKVFDAVSEIHAIEINRQYTTELKTKILVNSLNGSLKVKSKIYVHCVDFFSFDFSKIFESARDRHLKLAVIGNPPWVTNSVQGLNNSKNVPVKSNRYHLRGIDAITGKGNFDISEAIVLSLLSLLQGCRGGVSFLLKNSVIRNIVMKQRQKPYEIRHMKQFNIDAGKEFDVSVEASCLVAELGNGHSQSCDVLDFYTGEFIGSYGWSDKAFVSDLKAYEKYSYLDGVCPFIWRSGLKHDCSEVVELVKQDGVYYNKIGERVEIEEDLVYPLIKSSDVAKYKEVGTHRYIIVPQRFIGEDSLHVLACLPKTYSYLFDHKVYFERRKSSIYKGKGLFSIFGIGEYSFMPYKIVVSALYKNLVFTLVTPCESKPVMLDDTCYQIGFGTLEEAESVLAALQSSEITGLIKAISFKDSKRVITKSLLMRLNINALDSYNSTNRTKKYFQPSLFD